ncbi:unnamed protein product [Soboliphyme baturini]|uniref:Enhancer of polycomb-like protein n=1 Tax=Soboliphyme baturini TaxID=241478 RepID=A0A183I9T5_9BILA|nr:unnamed protein product [Soboliphyme baturini]
MSKLSFRARALDANKLMPIFLDEELPDLCDYASINRSVPAMPSGMEKEEEMVSAKNSRWRLALCLPPFPKGGACVVALI